MPRRVRLGGAREAAAWCRHRGARRGGARRVRQRPRCGCAPTTCCASAAHSVARARRPGAVWDIDTAARGQRQRTPPNAATAAWWGSASRRSSSSASTCKQKSAARSARPSRSASSRAIRPALLPLDARRRQRSPLDDGAALPADRPLLVFLHGTMSSVAAASATVVDGRRRRRPGRRGGAARARGALRRERLRLRAPHADRQPDRERARPGRSGCRSARSCDLVSHSRGGLVGELLCLAERDRTKDDPLQGEPARRAVRADRTRAPSSSAWPLAGAAATARDAAYADDREALDAAAPAARRASASACAASCAWPARRAAPRWPRAGSTAGSA